MSAASIDIDTLDVAVEDLLRVEVSYGRLSLVLKTVLDKLRAQTDIINDLREGQADLYRRHGSLKKSMAAAGADSGLDEVTAEQSKVYDADDMAQMQDQIAKLKEEVRALRDRPSRPASASKDVKEQKVDLDDTILDDMMADHHRRLRNLEMKQEEKINDVFRQLGLRQPFKELEAGLKKAELARNVPGAVAGVSLVEPISLQAGKGSGTVQFRTSTPAIGGDLELTPQCDGLVFTPPKVVVPAGDTTSKEVQVAVSDDYVGLSSPFTTVSVARVGACENNVDASPFVCGGVHVEGLGQTGASSSRRGSKSTPSPPGSRKSSGAPGSGRKVSKDKGKNGGGAPITSVKVSKELSIEAESEPVYFNIDNAAEGGSIVMTPLAANCSFTPAQVLVPVGSKSSGSFCVTADPKAPAGEVPLTVSLMPAATNTNDIATASFSVQGVSVDGDAKAKREAHAKAQEEAAKSASKGTVRNITMTSAVVSVDGAESEYVSFIMDTPAVGESVKLIPSAPGINFIPSTVMVPVGHTQSTPFIIKASELASKGSVVLQCTPEKLSGNQNTFPLPSYDVVGLTVLEGALFGAGYEAIGVRSDSADSSPRLLRSGLSERMRGLVDDHERRLKGLETTLNAALDALAKQRAAKDEDRLKALESSFRALESSSSQPSDGPSVEDIAQTISRLKNEVNLLKANQPLSPVQTQRRTSGQSQGQGAGDGAAEDMLALEDRVAKLEDSAGQAASGADLEALKQQLAELSRLMGECGDNVDKLQTIADARESHKRRIEALEAAAVLPAAAPPAESGAADDGAGAADAEQQQELMARVAALEQELKGVGDDCKNMEGRLQKEEQNLKMLNTKVNSLASRSSDGKKTPDSSEGTDALAKEIQALKMALQELKDQVSNLTSLKAPKTDVNRIAGRVNELEDLLKLLSTKIDGQQKSAATRSEQALGTAGPGQEVPAGELSDLRILVNTHASMIDNLFADKASRDTVVRMGTELQDIKAMLESRPRMPSITAAVGSGGVDSQALEGILQMLEELQRKIKGLEDGKADKDWVESQFKKLASIVENIQLNKADASIVAGKAERDYVENALEKLRREVEQVMNNTNSGLIDTLDKSLNILRDMIDGKANHAELLKLRDALLSERKQDDTPEGLAGYKHYRCLSCNRKMDGMRPRPMGMNFMNFISHLPNPRTKQYTNSKVHNQTNLITASVQSSARAITASAEGEHGAASLPPIAAPDYVQPAPNSAPAGAGPM